MNARIEVPFSPEKSAVLPLLGTPSCCAPAAATEAPPWILTLLVDAAERGVRLAVKFAELSGCALSCGNPTPANPWMLK